MGDVPLTGPYQDQWILAQQAWQDATTRINQNRMDIWKRYGFTGQVDDKGNLTSFSADPNNPFGEYQQMGRTYAQGYQNQEDIAAARGLAGAGLGQADEVNTRFQMRSDQDRMATDLQRSMFDLADQQSQADYQKNSMYPTLQAQQTADNIQAGNYNTPPPPADIADPHPGTITNQQAAGQLGGVSWGGQFFAKRADLAAWLSKRGQNYNKWAKAHPDAAARLQ